ncbi:MAG: efflux RND transporter periplasmic adaptor subunit, partial [Magnetococcales bacterium]|nr:efflux RND transporter periplasmic adaptor subunit [Magnetococcales bacterium]
VPARLTPGLSKGMIVPAKLDVGNKLINTRVAQIYPMADAQRHTVTVKLDLPYDAPGGPGMYAEVMIPDASTPLKDMPIIPRGAVFRQGSLFAVYILNNNNEPEKRLVRVGGPVDSNSLSILSGLNVGERIVANPTLVVKKSQGAAPAN